MGDDPALIVFAVAVYVAFCGAVAFPRDHPVTQGSLKVLAATFALLVLESYRVAG